MQPNADDRKYIFLISAIILYTKFAVNVKTSLGGFCKMILLS